MVKNPGILVKRVELLECSTWFSVPSLLIYLSTMRQLSSYRWPSIKRIIFGGESYPISELKKLWKFFGNRATLVNVYGPTECTCICTQYIITEKDISALKGIPPLGQLIPNFSHIIVNENSERVNIGENGELLLIGPQVGLGYFNDIDRTKDAFINNPLNLNYNEITYRTGDLVKIDGQGILWFVGRKDNQIKHLGYRIELEEIESAIYSLPYIVEAIAIHHKNDHKSYLGAFISVRVKISEDAVINDLKTLLPTYMLPEIIKILEYLPKNSNGKLDRKILKSSFVNICEIY
jgi:D-alanine--poly(phosphoribitol) ligase subunit 1